MILDRKMKMKVINKLIDAGFDDEKKIKDIVKCLSENILQFKINRFYMKTLHL